MSTVENLRGGLTGSDFGATLAAARKRLTNRNQEMSLDFLKKGLAGKKKKADDGRIDGRELAEYVNDTADKAYGWVLDIARPFLRRLDQDIQDIGLAVLEDVCEDSEEAESNAQRREHYEERIATLLSFSPENDKDVREELEILPERKKFFDKMFLRINDITQLALLTDDLQHAENKGCLEFLLKSAKYGVGKEAREIFVEVKTTAKPTANGRIRAFGKSYELTDGVFGYFHDSACEKLALAISTRSRELTTIHRAEAERQKQEVSVKTETDVSPDELLFGAEVNEKTALLLWNHIGHQNAIRIRLSGNRLYIVSAIGSPSEALEKAQEEIDEPFVLLDNIISEDGEHLCLGKIENGKLRYDFGGFIKREIFPLACWIRSAAGMCLPNRLLPKDETRAPKADDATNGCRKDKQTALVDNDGREAVEPEVFYFRTVNNGAGTITVNLPEGFILHLDEAKDEEQELLAPARQVKLTKAAVMKIRRAIIGGRPKIILDDCDSVEVMKELQINGIPGVEWTETGRKNWVGLPSPLPGLLSFRYRLACESGELKPNTRR